MSDLVLRNRVFDTLKIGDADEITRRIEQRDIENFAAVSGDVNPAHLDHEFASASLFGRVIAHGMWSVSLISAVIGTKLPGPGTIYLGQDTKFLKPVYPGDTITAIVTVKEMRPEKRIVLLDTVCTNQDGQKILSGLATVIAPDKLVEWPKPALPDLS